jgi:hypothetical protein
MSFESTRCGEYAAIGLAINYFGKPISRNRVCQIARILVYSEEVRFGVIPDDVLEVIRPSKEDALTRRVNLDIDWAVQDGCLKLDPDDSEIVLPGHR